MQPFWTVNQLSVRKIWILGNFGASGPNLCPKNGFYPPFSLITNWILKIDSQSIPKQLLSRSLQKLDHHPSSSTGLYKYDDFNETIWQCFATFILTVSSLSWKIIQNLLLEFSCHSFKNTFYKSFQPQPTMSVLYCMIMALLPLSTNLPICFHYQVPSIFR